MRTRATTVIFVATLAAATAASAQRNGVEPFREAGSLGSDSAQRLPGRAIAVARHAIHVPDLVIRESPAHLDELAQWIAEFSAWKQWVQEWGNRRQPGWFTGYRQRQPRPDPPGWLATRCDDAVEDAGAMANACALLAEWHADVATLKSTTARATATVQGEESRKTTWWEHLHLDGGWPAMQSKVYGVIGMHATTSVRGRLQVFVAPGAIVLNVPTRGGRRAWKVAANWGVAYRLVEVTLPGGREALLHLNLAKAWLLSAGDDVPTKSTDFIGFSLTFNKAGN
jgi:hypothetical protein